MSTTIESLELDVQSSATSAVGGIDALTASLSKLKNATKGGVGLTSADEKLIKLSESLKGFGNLKISSAIGNQLKNIGSAATALNTTDFKGLADLGNALKSFSGLGKINLTTFTNNLPKLAQAMNSLNVEELEQKFRGLNSVLAPFATSLNLINSSFRGLPANMRNLINSTNQVVAANNKHASSWANVAVKATATLVIMRKAAHTVASWIHNTNSYIENLNLFHASMGEYANESQKYAEQVGEIMGIDPGEFMRNQGVFMTITEGFGVASDRAYIMSKNLTQLGYDLSSFFNIPFEESMQKLESGISGELEPLRRLGYDLSQARLKAVALSLGIDKTFESMTQAEKAQLRYYAIMKQVTVAQGDMSRTLNAPSNQLRILEAQVTQCARALGSIFIPALNAVLPCAIALAKVTRKLAEAIASLFGFELPKIDYSGISSGASSAEDLSNGLGDASKKAKKLKNALLGIDELNIISPPEDSPTNGGSGGLGVGGGDLGFELPEYNFLGDAIDTRINQATKALEKFLPLIGAIGAAFATWKLAKWIADLLGLTDVIGALTMGNYLSILAGLLLTVGGAILYVSGAFDALKNGMNWGNLLKMLAGMAGMISGVYLALMPFSTTLAPIAAAITAVATGFGLLAISLNDMESNGVNMTNLIGAFAGLGAAVVGLNIALKNCKLAIAPVIAPMTAFVGALQIVKGSFVDIVMNGASFSNVFGLIAGGVAAVTAAVWLWNAACAVNPILAIAMLVVGIVGAIASIAKAIGDAGTAAYESTEDFQVMENIIERSAEVSERCATAIDTMKSNVEALNTVGEDFAMASTLVSEIYAINENAEATNYDLELMAVKVDILNGLGIEGLSLSIDETTGRVVETREEVESLIASLEQEARMEAMRELLVQTYKDQYTAMSDAKKALQDYDAASIALNETAEKLADCPWYDFKTHSELTAAQKEQTEAVNAAQNAYAESMDTYDQLGDTLNSYTDEIIKLKKQELGVGDEMTSGLKAVKTSLDDTADSMEGYGKNIAEGLRDGVTENVKEDEYRSVWQKIGDWFTNLFGIHSPSTVFADYGKNIVEGLNNGISDNSGSSEGIIGTWVSGIKDWFSHGTSDGGINSTTFSGFANNIVNGFKDKVGSTYTNTKSNITAWASKAKEWFTSSSFGGVNTTTFSNYANDTIEGFKNKIGSAYVNTKSNVTTWASKTKEWFTSGSFGSVNASTFTSYANNVLEGFKNKIGNSYTNTQSNITTWASCVKSWFSGIASSSAFSGFASDVINGFKNKISASYSTAESSMTTFANAVKDWFERPGGSSLVSKFETIGSNIIQGFINGVNSLWDEAMRKIKDFGRSVIKKGEEGTEEHSPSKAFRRIGAFVIEGFNLGVESMVGDSFKVMDNWLAGINTYTPQLALAVDTSAVDRFNSRPMGYAIGAEVQSNINSKVETDDSYMYETMRRAMLQALKDSDMPENIRIQAEKKETTIVQVGNRTVTDAVTTQKKANGYTFVK